jgi:hypothetical protein
MREREFSPRNGEIKKYCSEKIIQKRPDAPGGLRNTPSTGASSLAITPDYLHPNSGYRRREGNIPR